MMLNINDRISHSDYKEYEKEATELLGMFPEGINGKLVIEDNCLLYQIYFLEDETNFFILLSKKIYYIEREYGLYAEMTPDDVVTDFYQFLDDCRNGKKDI